jgi:D-3-phosphoglycerate dehydrogenase
MNRVVLLDPGGTTRAVRSALAAHPEVEVQAADSLPDGEDVVAVLVPPEVPVGATELAPLPGVRIVAATSTGFDHLALEQIAAAGAWATHCPGYCDEEVAEHAIAFALDLLRGLTLLDRAARAGEWNTMSVFPRRVAGAVLGIVGLGRIGRQVAWRGQRLGMRVIGTDPLIDAAEAERLGVELVPLHKLMAAADVVTLHTVLTPQTRSMIGARELELLGPEGFLVNCARAALVDHAALGEALRRPTIGGCALDVLPEEPPSPEEPAFEWPRTLINPHAAWYSPQSADAPYRMCGEAVAAVLEGREPYGVLARPA